jgi:CheY-like chemotaxis protein
VDSQASIVNLQFSISDTGPGIAPKEMDKLFEAFAQTEIGRQAQEGTGLGLPISRKFVQLMGGDIMVKSDVGHGSTFAFDIAARVIDAADIEGPQSSRRVIALEPDQPRYRLLIVDDKPDSRTFLVKLLKPFDFDLKEAGNGQEAIEIWKVWEPHLIWMDLRMPVLDGYKAIRHIKSTHRGKQTVVIVLSAGIVDEDRTAVIAAGCDDFLRKPFREQEIFDLLHKHLAVRFVYVEEQKTVSRKQKAVSEEALTPEALATLPKALLAELQRAVEALDINATKHIIEQIRQQNELLADTLSELVKRFRFDLLQALFEKIE